MSTTKVTDALRTVTEVDAAKITTGTIPEARITTLDSTKLTGTVADARLPATALNSNVDLTTLSASNLTTGTVADARLPATALNSNVDLTTLSASNLTTGTVADARLGTVSASKLTGALPVISGANLTGIVAGADLHQAHQGIASLGLVVAIEHNKVAGNYGNTFIDIFQDNSGITTETTVDRNASEYVSTIVGGTTNATGTLVSDVQTASSSTTEVSGVFLYTDADGTNTIDQDLKLYVTANLQGTSPNWTGTTWTDVGDTAGNGGGYGTATTFSGSIKQVKLKKSTVAAGTQIAIKAVWANQLATVTGGTSPIDSSSNSHTLTAVDGATTSTTIKYWGTQSMQFDGTGDWYTVPDGSWADLGTGDFTMEAWVYYTGGSGYKGIIGSGNWGGPNYNWSWDMNSADRYPRLSLYNGGGEILVQMTTAVATSTWTHLAVCRSGGTITQYLNGTANGSTTSSTHNVASAGVVYIGNQSRNIPWKGNIQEVRISSNARYTGNFTSFGQNGGTIASPSNFTTDDDTLLLVHGSGTAGVTGKVAHLEGWAVNY